MSPRSFRPWILLGLVVIGSMLRAEDGFDRLDEALTGSAFEDRLRFRASGTLDLEGYQLQQPAPGLIYAESNQLFNPRLTVFLDAQFGPHVYFFTQARTDRGFDPGDERIESRFDEYALRITPWSDGRFNVQVGKFATVVGNWVARHGSWDNPFITAPLPYEQLTGIWDTIPPRSVPQLQNWAHLSRASSPALENEEKPLRTPLIWGPSYTTGAAVFGLVGKFDYAIEVKNAALSAHPNFWALRRSQRAHPAFSGRFGYRPNAMWNAGISASVGPYLQPVAAAVLAPGEGRGAYRETVFAGDLSFAWHHVQLWSEIYHARFSIPRLGRADTTAYYLEGKYKFTPQFFAALRWNQQLFATLPDGKGGRADWGRNVWRVDFAPTYRFTAHTQFKWQSSLLHTDGGPRAENITHAAQVTVRF